MKNVFAVCKLKKKGEKSVSGVIKLMPLPGGQASMGAVEHASQVPVSNIGLQTAGSLSVIPTDSQEM